MKTFVLLFSPPAVGKMTVGQALSRLTGWPLFHNHLSIELVKPFFDYGTPAFNRLNTLIRKEMLREIAESDLPGVIFTFVWALNLPEEFEYVDELTAPFRERGGRILYVELEADLEERLRRNETPNRLLHKPSKQDLEASRANILESMELYVENSRGDFPGSPHFKLNNTHLSPEEAATSIHRFLQELP